ncbi:Outer membrane receptor proteins, mostly Fe transport [Chitinophaga niabensis]|uniref:Outer membrane receptor proteins, mostly Fe transport n=1 Tax=Chitinophaga niabensis TaxID=536979 RepID=A0A1N6JJ10_9BACT|nr:Outer membrane receptor proteins, mostly Fe transport [Chitinophaga niabensis]
MLFAASATAQSIHGVVRHNNEPLIAATVVLMRTDSSIVKTVSTGKGGQFAIDAVPQGRYILSARFLGYQPYFTSVVSPFAQSIQISLLPLAQQLQRVSVQAQRPPAIEQRIDGLVYNPQGDLVAAGSNAQDLLQRVPFVTISQEGAISIRGNSSVKVFINNKPAEFYANNVADLLKSLSADDIAKVEVITHPSARYDAEGSAGVLNIWLKKNRLRGLTGTLSANANDIDQNYNLKFNYRMAKVYSTFEVYQNLYKSYNYEETERVGYNGFTLRQSSQNRQHGRGNYFTFNAGWEPDSTQALDVSMRLGIFPDFRESQLQASQFQESIPVREYARHTNRDGLYRSRGLTFSYNKRLGSNRELFVLGGYSARNNESGYIMQANAYKEKNENKGRNYDVMLQSDYVHPFSSMHKIETGIKYSKREINTDYALFNFDSLAGYEKDPQRSLRYHFIQNVMAAYLSYDLTVKEWKFRSGIRYEYTWLSAQELSLPPYHIIVPNIIISRRFFSKHTFNLSYSYRIQRPEAYHLSPSMDYSDSLNITTGNPDLVPEKINRFELGYSTVFSNNSSVSVSVYHSYANNSIQSIRVMKGNGVIYNSYANIAGNSKTGLSLNNTLNIGKRFKLNTNADLYYITFRSDTIITQRPYARISSTATYQLPKGFALEGSIYWESRYPLVYGYVTGWRNYFLGINKKLWGERAAVSLRTQSLTSRYFHGKGEFFGDTYIERFKRNFQRPFLRIGFTYKFGKTFNTRPERTRRSIEGL